MARTPVVAALSLLLAGSAAVGCGSSSSTSTAPTTTAPSTTTPSTSVGTPSTTTAASTEQPETAIWPFVTTAEHFDDPVDAAKGFAVFYLGFHHPKVGAFKQGDARSGEVEIQPDGGGPVTTVLVRQLDDDNWWVLGATTPNLQLTQPAALSGITSPVTLAGNSTAFEATVNVLIRQDGTYASLTSGTVMGGSNGEMGPFSHAFPFTAPTASRGAIVLKTMSAKDGSVVEATVVRVAFS